MDKVRPYRPMDHTGLFHTFAEVEPTKDGILQFANKHGWLGTDPHTEYDAADGSSMKYEPLNNWIDNIMKMRMMVDLWANLEDMNYLSKHIELKGYDRVDFITDEDIHLPDMFDSPYGGMITSEEFTVGFYRTLPTWRFNTASASLADAHHQ